MIKIIETNLFIDNQDQLRDFQSRVIEHESWDKYIEEIKNSKCVFHDGTMQGETLPRENKIDNLEYDDFHLNCDVYNRLNIKSRKLAYKIFDDSIFK